MAIYEKLKNILIGESGKASSGWKKKPRRKVRLFSPLCARIIKHGQFDFQANLKYRI